MMILLNDITVPFAILDKTILLISSLCCYPTQNQPFFFSLTHVLYYDLVSCYISAKLLKITTIGITLKRK